MTDRVLTTLVGSPDPRGHIYVAGPMRGIPDFNFPAFDAAADALRDAGFHVFNPAQRDRDVHGEGINISPTGDEQDFADKGGDIRAALAADTAYISLKATGICVLPGHGNSRGARAEVALANALDIPVMPLHEWLEQADAVVAFDTPDGTLAVGDSWDAFEAGLALVDPTPAQVEQILERVVSELPTSARSWTPSVVGETLVVSDTGGAKGSKPERYDLIPIAFEDQVARLFAAGARKYADHNWRQGYPISLSYAAARRHLAAFWNGEDNDPDTSERLGVPITHAACVAFHMAVIIEHLRYPERYGRFDDRYRHPSA